MCVCVCVFISYNSERAVFKLNTSDYEGCVSSVSLDVVCNSFSSVYMYVFR